ncbi:ribosome maturation factor RimM [Parasulfitobacter algicola]|uniref:Ribosome maturation factor RimM n=1 Tax=Parasulfitobacter algicola TaxID=2614809 RepID=A0ABX2ISC2_9RHOB|nr:ribosome maturation factor RimM [Sulfitobacter algicola]NSX53259.1 16S rRNA processing protein RimM [Sulfitobacter algicola]
MTDLVCVGVIAGAYGVKGQVRLKSFCADPQAIFGYRLSDETGEKEFHITLSRPMKNGFVAQVKGLKNKEEADDLKGVKLYSNRDDLPDLDEDEYYHADLIGMDVLDTGGTILGQVKSVMNHGAADLIEVHGPGLKDTVLLPFTRDIIPTVDMATRRIIADPPEGFFPGN